MSLNAAKHKCVHYDHDNRQYDYFMCDDPIKTSREENDLGVIVRDKLEVTEQCTETSN